MAIDMQKPLMAAIQAALDEIQAEPPKKRHKVGAGRALLVGAGLYTAGRVAVKGRGSGMLDALQQRLPLRDDDHDGDADDEDFDEEFDEPEGEADEDQPEGEADEDQPEGEADEDQPEGDAGEDEPEPDEEDVDDEPPAPKRTRGRSKAQSKR